MRPPLAPLFVEHRTYRRRRLTDSARLLPMAGVLVFLIPLMWPAPAGEPPGTAQGGIFIFAAWGLLILAAALISRALTRTANAPRAADGGAEETGG